MSRNEAFDALLAIAQQIEPVAGTPWGETGRKMKAPEQSQMPALFQVEGDCEHESRLGQMIRRKEQVTWVILHDFGKDQARTPAQYSQDIKDSIEAKFGDRGISYQSLSGLVYAVYIEGAIRRFPGDLDGTEMITVPLSLLLP